MPRIPDKAIRKTEVPSVIGRIGWDGLSHDGGLKVLIYGRSGTGKTTFCSTAPRPILHIICSGGNKPGEMRSIDTPENRKDIDPVVLQSSSEIKDLVSYQESTRKYQTIVLDHGSGFQDLEMMEVCGFTSIPTQLSQGSDSSRTVSQPQWGEITYRCKEEFRRLLSLSCNVLMIAQEREFKSEGSEDIILPSVGAALTPGLAGWLNCAVDYIVQTSIRPRYIVKQQRPTPGAKKGQVIRTRVKGEYDYVLRVGPHDIFTTKFRVPRKVSEVFPEVIIDPSFDKVLALLQ